MRRFLVTMMSVGLLAGALGCDGVLSSSAPDGPFVDDLGTPFDGGRPVDTMGDRTTDVDGPEVGSRSDIGVGDFGIADLGTTDMGADIALMDAGPRMDAADAGPLAAERLPVVHWVGPLPPEPQDRPDLYMDVMDSVFGTRFRRVTNDGDRGYYSLRPVFNDDSTLFLLNSGRIRAVADGTSLGTTFELSGRQPFRNPTWSKVDADILYGTIGLRFVALNVRTATVRTIRDMEAMDGFVGSNIYMDNQQAIAGADHYIVLSDVARGGHVIVVVNIQTGARRAWIPDAYSHPDFSVRVDDGPDYRMNVGISPSGNYIVLSGRDDLHLFDGEFRHLRTLANHGHADFAIDTDGAEVLVSICPAKMERLHDGHITDLLTRDSYACGHLSANAAYRHPGWVYLSINRDDMDRGANGNSQGYEIVAVQLDPADGAQVQRIVHPRNTGDANETSSFGVPNPDGTLLMFNSSWDNAGTVEAYIVDLTTGG